MAKRAIQVMLDEEVIGEIDQTARDEATTRSAVARRLIVQALRK